MRLLSIRRLIHKWRFGGVAAGADVVSSSCSTAHDADNLVTNKRANKRLRLGYWHEEPTDGHVHPQPLVDHAWEIARRDRIVQYLRTGSRCGYFLGFSYCRFGCTRTNGCTELCDDMWCWPEGLAHYVEKHDIRLPDEFVAHAAARGFEPAPPVEGGVTADDGFWRTWCEVNAPFTYERRCSACRRSRQGVNDDEA
jgi:hypothetical protein